MLRFPRRRLEPGGSGDHDAPGYGRWTVKASVPHVRPPVPVLERILTARVHLDRSDAALGPLRVVPGSLTEGRLGVAEPRQWLERGRPETCPVPEGVSSSCIRSSCTPRRRATPRGGDGSSTSNTPADNCPAACIRLKRRAPIDEIHEDARDWQ